MEIRNMRAGNFKSRDGFRLGGPRLMNDMKGII